MSLFIADFNNKITDFYGIIADEIIATTLEIDNLEVNDLVVDNDLTVNGDATFQNDVTVSTGDVKIEEGDLTVSNNINVVGNVTTTSGIVEAQSFQMTGIVPSVSPANYIGGEIIDAGVETWEAGEHLLPLNIDLLIDGIESSNDFKGVSIQYKFHGQPTNSDNYMILYLNGDIAGKYNTRIIQDGSPLVDQSNETHIAFIKWNNTTEKLGCGTVNLWLGKNETNNLFLTGTWTSSSTGGGVSAQAYTIGAGYRSEETDQLDSMSFDITTANHNGWTLEYIIKRWL